MGWRGGVKTTNPRYHNHITLELLLLLFTRVNVRIYGMENLEHVYLNNILICRSRIMLYFLIYDKCCRTGFWLIKILSTG